ncbi:MAG: carboxypeptidase regulatory-like domain-containing protein [SAR324 cluster bacterium]|nr:carboxypeptidase regulatory-like domain-containing protein [SAR324 cluster bacterium]
MIIKILNQNQQIWARMPVEVQQNLQIKKLQTDSMGCVDLKVSVGDKVTIKVLLSQGKFFQKTLTCYQDKDETVVTMDTAELPSPQPNVPDAVNPPASEPEAIPLKSQNLAKRRMMLMTGLAGLASIVLIAGVILTWYFLTQFLDMRFLVQDELTAKPLPGATVILHYEDGDEETEVTGIDGLVEFTRIPKEEQLRLDASFIHYETGNFPSVCCSDSPPVIPLARKKMQLEVKVVDLENDQPIAGAAVTIQAAEGLPVYGVTESSGSIRLTALSGLEYSVEVSVNYYESEKKTVECCLESFVKVSLSRHKSEGHFRVIDSETEAGIPQASASLVVGNEPLVREQTDANGIVNFFKVSEGIAYELTATAGNYQPSPAPVKGVCCELDSRKIPVIQLTPEKVDMPIQIKEMGTNDPVDGAVVRLTLLNNKKINVEKSSQKDGMVTLNVSKTKEYKALVQHSDFVVLTSDNPPLVCCSATPIVLELTRATVTPNVKVVDLRNRQGISGAVVHVKVNGKDLPDITADKNGLASIPDIEKGRTVIITAEKNPTHVLSPKPVRDRCCNKLYTLELPRTPVPVAIKVLNSQSGRPIAGADVIINDVRGTTSHSGMVQLNVGHGDTVQIKVEARNYKSKQHPFVCCGVTSQEIKLEPQQETVQLKILSLKNNQPVTNAEVILESAGSVKGTTDVDGNVMFAEKLLWMGTPYTILITAPQHEKERFTMDCCETPQEVYLVPSEFPRERVDSSKATGQKEQLIAKSLSYRDVQKEYEFRLTQSRCASTMFMEENDGDSDEGGKIQVVLRKNNGKEILMEELLTPSRDNETLEHKVDIRKKSGECFENLKSVILRPMEFKQGGFLRSLFGGSWEIRKLSIQFEP